MAGKYLELVEVKKSFLEVESIHEVLKNNNLKFHHGKWYTIYGASGSGKTTLLNILGGLENPDKGHLYCTGTDV
jgi:ABC-type lipoprotein export system ATPase subunit